jgi:signal transduction histidine kinase
MEFEPGEREQYGEIIHQNTEMILKMIDSVMEKAQIETGSLEILQKPVSVQKLVNECYNTNRIIAPAHLQFILEMAGPDTIVNIDLTRTKQVVNNFLSNAFKFTTEGSVTLGWKYMEDDNSMIEIYVKDTGIGVEQEKQAALFERYTKVNETDRGTGLGLNISKTIIEKQNGVIGVESELGKGSKFFFRLSQAVQCLILAVSMGLGAMLSTSCLPNRPVMEKSANVLVYHGYSKDLSSYTEFNDVIQESFIKNGVSANLFHVNLELGLPNQDTYLKHRELEDSLKSKGWLPDIILIEGDRTARDFLYWKREGMLEELDSVPVVFGGLHHPEWDLIRTHPNMVVINDPIDYCTNINLAVEMTGKNSVEIELDYFYQDSLIRQELRKAIARPPYVDNSDFHLRTHGNGRFDPMYKDSIIVMLLSSESPEKNVHEGCDREHEGFENLSEIYTNAWMFPSLTVKRDIYSASIVDKTGRPQFTAVKAGFALGDGRFLCGYFADYRTVGQDMVDVAIKVLKGADPTSFVGIKHEKKYYMDYKAMQMLGMEYDDYKERFTIVGAPPEKTKPIFTYITWGVIVLVFLLAIFSIILVVQSWRERTSNNLLENVKRRAESRNMALNGADSYTVRSEARIKEIISHIHPNYASEIPLMMQAIEIIGTHKYEIYADVDGENDFRWWQLRFIVMIDKKTSRRRVDGILINIDKTKKYEEDLRQAMELAEEARQKEDFLTTISHEIRTPLNAVVGFSDVMVNMPVDSFTPEELAEYTKIIKTNNANLTAMIEDILMFSRIESGRIKYVKEEFDATDLVREVAAEWEDIVPDGVTLQTLAVYDGITINNDRMRVKYIISQLLGNAMKFTKKGTIVVGVTYQLNSDVAEFFVLDTGCGIPKEKQDLAFGLFWKDNGFIPGLGLGLHVVKKMAEGMDLRIKLESKVGFGSRFSVFADGFLKKTEEQ